MAASGGFSYTIPQQTLGASGFSVNLNLDRPLYLTLANLSASGGPSVTIKLGNSAGNSQTFTCQAGSVIGPLPWTFRTISITGSGATVIGIVSTSKVNAETLLAMSVSIQGTVDTDSIARGWNLNSNDLPGKSWDLGSNDHPVPYGANGAAFPQDTSVGTLFTTPVLAGGSTPISSHALQYDTNNYPLVTQGNVTGNGGIMPLPAALSQQALGASNTGSVAYTVPDGQKFASLSAIAYGVVIQNNETSASLVATFGANSNTLSLVNKALFSPFTSMSYQAIPTLIQGPSSSQNFTVTVADEYGTAEFLAAETVVSSLGVTTPGVTQLIQGTNYDTQELLAYTISSGKGGFSIQYNYDFSVTGSTGVDYYIPFVWPFGVLVPL
jgi:hypothetical protein